MTENLFRKALVVLADELEGLRLRQLLLRAGLGEVLLARNGVEALTRLSGELIDLVFSEFEPEGTDPLAIISKAGSTGKSGEVPVILLERGLPKRLIVSAVKAGAFARLSLPADLDSVQEIMASLSREYQGSVSVSNHSNESI